MSDDPTKRGPADRKRINTHERWEIEWWCKQLEVTPARLRAAVQKVGPMVSDVRRALKK